MTHPPVIASLATLSIVYGKRDTFRCAFCGRQGYVVSFPVRNRTESTVLALALTCHAT